MQNRYFTYFSDFSHIGVDFRILICEFAYYAWGPCMRQKLRKISSLKIQTSVCESISFRIESSSLSAPAGPLRSFQREAEA